MCSNPVRLDDILLSLMQFPLDTRRRKTCYCSSLHLALELWHIYIVLAREVPQMKLMNL